MVVKYCEHCQGRPYTTDLQMNTCPKCGKMLGIESADETELEGRREIFVPEKSTFSKDEPEEETTPNKLKWRNEEESLDEGHSKTLPTEKKENTKVSVIPEKSISNSFIPDECIRGRVAQYSSTGKEDGEYRRLLPVKIYQAIVYRQRLEDVLHRFTVRVEQGEDALGYQNYTDIPVNVHGTIAGGLQIVDNAEVEVHGKYKNGVLMADSVYVINNGYESKVGFQHSVKAITYGILSAIMLAFICFVAASSNGNFIANIKEFFTVWFVIAAILTVLYLITSLTKIGLLTRMFSNKRRTFPLFGILLISLALAFLFVSVFGSFAGFGSYLSGWIYSLVPIIIIVVALFLIIKSMF